MKDLKTKEDFEREHISTIIAILFEHQKKHDSGMTISELYNEILNYYEVTRYIVENRANTLTEYPLVKTTVRGKKAYIIHERYFYERSKNPPVLNGSGHEVDKNREKLDRAIISAVKRGMIESHSLFPKSRMWSDEEAMKACGVRIVNVIKQLRKNRTLKHIKDHSIRTRINSLINRGEIINGRHRSSGLPAVIVKGYYIKINNRIR